MGGSLGGGVFALTTAQPAEQIPITAKIKPKFLRIMRMTR